MSRRRQCRPDVGLLLVGKDHPAAAVGRQAHGSRWPRRLRPAPARSRRGIGDRGPGVGGMVELEIGLGVTRVSAGRNGRWTLCRRGRLTGQ